MGKGLKIVFDFVPMPLEAFDPGNPVREAGLRLLAYILKHTRFGEAFPEVSYEELLKGILDQKGRRRDSGCGLSRNGIKHGQIELEQRGWLEATNMSTDKSRPRWKYRLILGSNEVSPSDNALSRNDSVTKGEVVSPADSALSPSDSGTVTKCEVQSLGDTCNKEERKNKSIDKKLEKGGAAPRSTGFLIAQEHFFKILGSLRIDQTQNIDAELMRIIHIAAAESGIGRVAAKGILREHPDWKHWPYLEQIDSQAEIAFPPPPRKSEPVAEDEPVRAIPAINPWSQIQAALEKKISPHSYDTWLKPTRFSHIEDKVIVVRIPTPEFRHIEDKFGDLIAEAMNTFVPEFRQVKFVTGKAA